MTILSDKISKAITFQSAEDFHILIQAYGKGYGKSYIARSNTTDLQRLIEAAREFKTMKDHEEIQVSRITYDEYLIYKSEGISYLGFLSK